MTSQDIWLAGGAACLCFLVFGTIYRLYWSPLASIPGPKLAALTGYYELYYDLFQGARFPWKLLQLHDRYGKRQNCHKAARKADARI